MAGGCFSHQHIVLVGMMGVGKSAVGRTLAAKLDRPLLDTDALVESGPAGPFATSGRWRAKRLSATSNPTCSPTSCRHSNRRWSPPRAAVVLRPENRALLSNPDAHVVWLCADVHVLLNRVRNGMHRPALDDDPEGTLTRMFEMRAPLYKEVADAIVSVDHRSVGDVTQAVLRCCA